MFCDVQFYVGSNIRWKYFLYELFFLENPFPGNKPSAVSPSIHPPGQQQHLPSQVMNSPSDDRYMI